MKTFLLFCLGVVFVGCAQTASPSNTNNTEVVQPGLNHHIVDINNPNSAH